LSLFGNGALGLYVDSLAFSSDSIFLDLSKGEDDRLDSKVMWWIDQA